MHEFLSNPFTIWSIAQIFSLTGNFDVDAARITFFDQLDFRGKSINVDGDPGRCTNLPVNWNDRASSMHTNNECVIIFEDINCEKKSTRVEPGTPWHHRLDKLNFDESITSMYVCTLPPQECAGITVDVDTSRTPDLYELGQKAKKIMVNYFPKICRLLRSSTYLEVTEISLKFDPKYNGVAVADSRGRHITAGANYFRRHPDDLGSLINVMAQVIQRYNKCAGWVTAGIADWTRRYHYEPVKPTKPRRGETYQTNMVFFLNWMDAKYPDILYTLNAECRAGTYEDSIFQKLTGKNPDQLWEDMMREA